MRVQGVGYRAQAQGKTEFAALLPETDFGRSMGDALVEACASAGLSAPTIIAAYKAQPWK